MKLVKQFNLNNKISKLALAILLASFATNGALVQIAFAQEEDNSRMSEEVLPPEIVPLDPTTASTNNWSANQTTSTASSQNGQMPAIDDANTPGMAQTDLSGLQTAKDFRQSAFSSLYGQGELNPQVLTPQWHAQQNNMEPNAPGQNNIANNNYSNWQANAGPNSVPAQPSQSQTLTGGVKYKPVMKDIRRGGITNTLSALAGFGAGALTSTYLMRPQYAPMGLGIFGLTMTGFGVRNGFRF